MPFSRSDHRFAAQKGIEKARHIDARFFETTDHMLGIRDPELIVRIIPLKAREKALVADTCAQGIEKHGALIVSDAAVFVLAEIILE